MTKPEFNETGSKYLRFFRHLKDGYGDVYTCILAFDVRCPARAHAIKKLLCAGLREKGDALQDLREAQDAVKRAIQLEEDRLREESEIVDETSLQSIRPSILVNFGPTGKVGRELGIVVEDDPKVGTLTMLISLLGRMREKIANLQASQPVNTIAEMEAEEPEARSVI